jgi:hypothetical protein
MSHISSSLNQGKFFNEKINSYKPLENYESDILNISNKQYLGFNNSIREGFDVARQASEIHSTDTKPWIIYENSGLKFNPTIDDSGLNIQPAKADAYSSGGRENVGEGATEDAEKGGKQSVWTSVNTNNLIKILKAVSDDSTIYAAHWVKDGDLRLFNKNTNDEIPHATYGANNTSKAYPQVVTVTGSDGILFLRPGTGEIPENKAFGLVAKDDIIKKDFDKISKMQKLQRKFNIHKRSYELKLKDYLAEKASQHNAKGKIKSNVLYKTPATGNTSIYTYITPRNVKRIIDTTGVDNIVTALNKAKCPVPEALVRNPVFTDGNGGPSLVENGLPIKLGQGGECNGGAYIINKVDSQDRATDDYAWIDKLGKAHKLAGGKPGSMEVSTDANGNSVNINNPHISCTTYMPANKVSATRWGNLGLDSPDASSMGATAVCGTADTSGKEAELIAISTQMDNIIGTAQDGNSMFGLAANSSGDTDKIDEWRNIIRTGHGMKDGKDDKGNAKFKSDFKQKTGLDRPLNDVALELKAKKKTLAAKRAEVAGLRTSFNIKTQQVDGMSLHYIAWVLAGVAIGGIVLKNVTTKQ